MAEMRNRYLFEGLKEITWLRNISAIEKRRDKNEQLTQLIQMYCDLLDEYIRKFCVADESEWLKLLEEFENLINYVRVEFKKISQFYNVMPWVVNNIGRITTNKRETALYASEMTEELELLKQYLSSLETELVISDTE
jgi:hypothetical protein